MVPLIQDEIVDKRKWIDKEDFIDLLALTQSVPGIFAVNIAIFIGYKLRKFRGALAMALGTILPLSLSYWQLPCSFNSSNNTQL